MSGSKRAVVFVGAPLALLALPFGLQRGQNGLRVAENVCGADAGTCCPETLSMASLHVFTSR
jgi:hypothetical protein